MSVKSIQIKNLIHAYLLPFFSGKNKAHDLYTLIKPDQCFGDQSLFVNLGYWTETKDFDQACETLALKLAEYAELKADHIVLDAGSGFGDAANLWMTHYKLESVTSINIMLEQLKVAKKRYPDSRLLPLQANAINLPFKHNHFDRVLALESALHFYPREKFLEQSYQVLKPGGILALADLVLEYPPKSFKEKLGIRISCNTVKMPYKNCQTWSTYKQLMEQCGFKDIEYVDVSRRVLKGFMLYLHKQKHQVKLHVPIWQLILTKAFKQKLPIAYYLIKAKK